MIINSQIFVFFSFDFTAAFLRDNYTTYIQILSKSVKFQISIENQEFERIAPHLIFSEKLFKIDLFFLKHKNVPKCAEANNGNFKHKIAKN